VLRRHKALAEAKSKKEVKLLKKEFIRAASILLVIATLLSPLAISTSARESERSGFPAGSSTVNVQLNGRAVLQGRSALINSVTYVAIRDFVGLFEGFEISWDAKTRTAVVNKGTHVVTATVGDRYVYAQGRCFYTVEPIIIIDNSMFLPVRAIAKAIGVDVSWDNATRSVTLKDTGVLPRSGSDFYNADDLYWLSRIISAEAKGEGLLGQIAVGNVVLNRKAHPSYPNTVYGVIFDRKHGTQFSPVSFGTIYQKPTASSIIAAKICLEGYSLSNRIIFFMNPRIATNHWISQNRTFEFRIGNHDFYS
jgi:N-acetylmuramoyl-L-alanine amidase